MSDDNADAFDDAFEGTTRDEYESVSIDRAKVTANYLADLVDEEPRISEFSVSELIEHLDRRI